MTIQEFSRELSQPQHPSPLIQALQAMREDQQIRWAGDWIPWGENDPGASVEQLELN